MAGERDRLTPPSHARRLERSLPRPAGLVLVPGAGHMLSVEAADEVNRRVREFARPLLGMTIPQSESGDAAAAHH
jgi:pimeloyl-ACP methyl ester carboxylesterase